MNNVFKNQDIRGIILSKKKQMIDEEVFLELLLNETHFRHKIMLEEIKYHIVEVSQWDSLVETIQQSVYEGAEFGNDYWDTRWCVDDEDSYAYRVDFN